MRDEAANLGWAAELRVESAAGRTVDRAALARAALSPPPSPSSDAWLYRLTTPVPDHHVPLVPVQTAAGGLALRRGLLAVAVDGGEVATRGAIGAILEPGGPLSIHDDEIPPTGVTVTRTWQMARTLDGGVVVGSAGARAPADRAARQAWASIRSCNRSGGTTRRTRVHWLGDHASRHVAAGGTPQRTAAG